ncbi:MAG: translation elongation factor 4 [Planctomycetota bacterium]|jgi:GTP-binding protein LepA|nr:translation elongation factor 4 [Planctomycetota bacterium]
MESIRNFCIIAHIDHGKSTLADRLLEMSGFVDPRKLRNQMLDDMDLERERGITIKAKAVEIEVAIEGEVYQLNLIDTPGHVDFSYEVSRSLSACEGALLVVDAAQGIQAQTMTNVYLAMEAELEIIPVLNKIDLPTAQVDQVLTELEQSLGFDPDEVHSISAKTGLGCEKLIEHVVRRVPPPKGEDSPLRALIFDSEYDEFRGVIVYVRIVDGVLRKGDRIRMIGTRSSWDVVEIGKFRPDMVSTDKLGAGEVGYCIAGIKTIKDVIVGDTITRHDRHETVESLPGYIEPKPMVFCGLYPAQGTEFHSLRGALEKLSLNDSSFSFQPESSPALGFGFRCGFLGLLHMEIVQERLERESNLELVQTAPNVTYKVVLRSGEKVVVHRPADLPDTHQIQEFTEPFVNLSLILPSKDIGGLMKLLETRRGEYRSTEYLSPERVLLRYEVPLAEILYDFFDRLKSLTSGYGTMDYELIGYRASDLVKLRILVAGDEVDALSIIVHREKADRKGRTILKALREQIPRHLFQIAIQAAIGGKIVARENIRALSKNVVAKCYGGDVSRKRKLMEKQKEGKRRMKSIGRVSIPQEAFLAVLSGEDS